MSEQKITAGIYTLGCKVNQYESEAIAERLREEGIEILSPTSRCDIYIINTCTVTAESDRKARQFIRRAIKQNPDAYVLVTGCLAQVDPLQIASIKGVDFICGNNRKLLVVDAVLRLLRDGKKPEKAEILSEAPDANGFEAMSINRFDRTRAYVKIEDGCENHCAYCIIPSARGQVRSKAPEEVVAEVTALTQNGCLEVVLTGIETASYGKDLDGYKLSDLLTEVDKIPNVGRIRLGSLDPSLIKQPFVDAIAELPSVVPHFHLSMQSGSDRILAAMKRKYNSRMALENMERLRRAMPNVQFTTDMIAGFPGETEEAFAETLDFIRKARFLMIHAFPYSKRKGTVAAELPNQVPEEIKHARVAAITALQAEIRAEILAEQIGEVSEVLFETYKNGIAYGHTPSFIEVACPTPCPLTSKLLPVRILAVEDGCCVGELV